MPEAAAKQQIAETLAGLSIDTIAEEIAGGIAGGVAGGVADGIAGGVAGGVADGIAERVVVAAVGVGVAAADKHMLEAADCCGAFRNEDSPQLAAGVG